MNFNKKNLFLMLILLSLNSFCFAEENPNNDDGHSFGYMAAAKEKAGKALAVVQAVLNYEPFAESREDINNEFTNSATKAFGEDTAIGIPTTPEYVRRHAALPSFKKTKAHKTRTELKQLFSELNQIDESIKNIPSSNGYFYNLLKDAHECNNCDGNCPTNKPLTNHDIILDANNVALFSYLKDKRSEKLNAIRNIYKETSEMDYTLENSESVNDASDSEYEGDRFQKNPRISTKKILKRAKRHTNKIYDTSYNKLDSENKAAVPALKDNLEATQQHHENTPSDSGWIKSIMTGTVSVLIPVIAKTLSEQ